MLKNVFLKMIFSFTLMLGMVVNVNAVNVGTIKEEQLEERLNEVLKFYENQQEVIIHKNANLNKETKDFLLENLNEILNRLENYKGVDFRLGKHFFLSEKETILKLFQSQEKDLDIIEVSAYTCENCLRLNDLVYQYRTYKNFNNKIKLNAMFVPIAIRDDVNKRYLVADSMVTLSIGKTLNAKNVGEEKFREINNRLMFDTVHNKLNLVDQAQIKAWLEKNDVDYAEYQKHFNDEETLKFARIIADQLTDLELRTVPMLVINGKYTILKNIVNVMDRRFYDEDLSMALLDYVSILALLEKKGVVSVNKVLKNKELELDKLNLKTK